jgi:transcriptional regulator with XRE-family HTH domain
MEICQVIRLFRESRNLSAEQLALSLGIETSTITRAERGERRLSTLLLEQIAAALNTGVTDLYAIVEGRTLLPEHRPVEDAIETEEALLRLRKTMSGLSSAQRTLIVELAAVVARGPDATST